MIDKGTVDRIYAAANIVEVVGDFVTLKKKGVNYQACCPFHNERTPSFVVSPSKGVFKCFGCGKGGNAVTFVMEHEGMSYVDALKYVARKYGIEVQERELSPDEAKKNDDRESMMVVNSFAAGYFRDTLHNTDEGTQVGLSYFRQRGFTNATIEKFGLGYCPAAGDAFTKKALEGGYKEDFLVATGLTIKRDRGGWYDRFAGRVIFPIHTISGRVTAFGGRTLRTDKHVSKYLNSPESEVYNKSNNLYGLFFAKRAIQQENYCILVEGYTDVIQMHQSGIENVVASSGTSLTVDQIRLIGRFTKNVTVIYDGDPAGIKASLRGIDMILHEGLNVRVVLLPEPEDPDSFAKSRSATEVKEYIRANEEDFIAFKTRILLRDAGDDPVRRAELIREIVQSISEIPDPITRSVFIRECAKNTGTEEQLLVSEVARKRMSHAPEDRQTEAFIRRQQQQITREQAPPFGSAPAGSSIPELEKEIVRDLLRYGHRYFEYKEGRSIVNFNVARTIIDDLRENEIVLKDARYRAIFECYAEECALLGEGKEVPAHIFVNHPDPEVCNAAVDILTADSHYVSSELWRRHEIVIESEEERLGISVPRAVMLYKSKAIEGIISTLQEQLKNDDLAEERLNEIMYHITALNRERMELAKRLSRLIL